LNTFVPKRHNNLTKHRHLDCLQQ